ncbi:MAG: hypothetical protein KBT04_08240 [Bacteroidales bacterium]|nr:hypothetical protein [Candidatus Colimorpha onthohippi]
MQFSLSYSEIQNLIASKTGKNLTMLYGGAHTVRVGYDVSILFKTTSIGIDVTVDRIVGSDIFLSFAGGAGIEFMIREALKRASGQPGADCIEMTEGSSLVVHLGKSSQAAALLERLVLQDIHFDEQRVMIDFTTR